MNPYLLVNIKQSYRPTAPTNYDDVFVLMSKLPHKTKIIYALEAIKIAQTQGQGTSSSKKAIQIKNAIQTITKKAIQTIEKWLKGQATIDEVKKVVDINNHYRNLDNTVAAIEHIWEAIDLSMADVSSYTAKAAEIAMSVGVNASDAIYYAAKNYDLATLDRFYTKWWLRCCLGKEKEFQDKYDILCKTIYGDI